MIKQQTYPPYSTPAYCQPCPSAMHFSTVMPVVLRSETEPLTSTRVSVKSWMQVGLWNGLTEATVVGLGGTLEVLEEVGLVVVVMLGVTGAVLVVEPGCDVELGLLVDAEVLELSEVDLVLVLELDEVDLVLMLEGGFEVTITVAEVVAGPTGGVVDVGSRSGSVVDAAEQPPFAHTWPRGQTLHAVPREHLVPGLSQHTASEA